MLLYRIARECGFPDVDRMAATLSARQVMEWNAFFALEREELERLTKESKP